MLIDFNKLSLYTIQTRGWYPDGSTSFQCEAVYYSMLKTDSEFKYTFYGMQKEVVACISGCMVVSVTRER